MTVEPTQAIRNDVADYLSPPGSVLTSAIANRHVAEEIRAGRQDGNALVQLVAGCVVAVAPTEGGLLPCPFCGEPPHRFPANPEIEGDAFTLIACTSERCVVQPRTKVYSDDKAAREREAVAAWNARQQHAPPSPSGCEAGLDELRAKLRMIVSHATCGHSQDIDASVNDICVRISANRNFVYRASKDRALEDAAKVAEHEGRREVFEDRRGFYKATARDIAAAIRTLKKDPAR